MNLKAPTSKRAFKKGKIGIQIITFIVASLAVMVIHSCMVTKSQGPVSQRFVSATNSLDLYFNTASTNS